MLLSDALKAELPLIRRGRLKSLIAAREVKVNGKRVDADVTLAAGDVLDAFVPDAYLDNTAVDIIYSDENIVIADKPPKTDSQTALPALLAARFGTLFPAHRLDTNTTGLIILARSRAALDSLTAAFKNRTIEKTYTASVCGQFKQKAGMIKCYLLKNAESGIVTAYDKPVPGGVEAITGYEVISCSGGVSEIRLSPKTGRTHQLRVQLAHAGHPILGDGKYGDFEMNRKHGAATQQLRAESLRLSRLAPPLDYLNGKNFYEGKQ